MKTIMRFALMTAIVLMLPLFVTQYCAPQSSTGSTVSAQAPSAATQNPELDAKKKELLARGSDETLSLDERKAALDQLLALDKSDLDAIKERNAVNQKIDERSQQKAAAEKDKKAKSANEEKLNLACSEGIAALRAGDLPRAKALLDSAQKLNPDDPRVRDLRNSIHMIESRENGKIVGICILGGLLLAGILALIVRALRPKRMALRVIDGSDIGYVFPIEHPKVRVGTSPDHSEIVISDESRRISRVHFELYRSGNRFYIRDLSSNGTKVNDKPLTRGETASIKVGDVISLADAATLELFVAGKDVLQQAGIGGV